jgi:photosystem II stability/assembly factor-like uncharacterized protein
MDAYVALDDRVLVVTDLREDPCAREHLVGHDFECLAASSEAPDRVFTGTVESGLQRSTDGGETWESVGSFDGRVTAVTVSPHDPEVIWAGTEPSAVYRSADGGETWTEREGLTDLPSTERWSFPPRPHTHHVRWLSVDPQDPETLYVAIEAGAFVRTTDGGETWEPHPEDARLDNHTLATHSDAPGRIYTAAGDGYAESDDGGETWSHPQDGLEHRYVWGLAVDSEDLEQVVVSAADGARSAHTPETAEAYVYRRSGGQWERAMDGLPAPEGQVRAVLGQGTTGEEFVAVTNRGIFLTDDGARSWHAVDINWPEEYCSQVGRGLAVVE